MTSFLTTKERKHRIAELAAEITAIGGTPPQNCDGFKTSHEAKAEIAKMETILADCRAKKAKSAPGTPMPLIGCLAEKTAPSPAAVKTAVQARLDAGKAALAAAEARAQAKIAAAAIQPAANVTAADYLASIAKPTMTRAEFEKIPHGQRGEAIKRVKLIP